MVVSSEISLLHNIKSLPNIRRSNSPDIYKICLNNQELSKISQIISQVVEQYHSSESDSFLTDVSVIAHKLPIRLKKFINIFRQIEIEGGICIVSGYPIDEAKIGNTPAHWNSPQRNIHSFKEEIFLMLLGSLLGDAIGWKTQQSGYIVHNVIPIKKHEHEQLGCGSMDMLTWHTEDAFHPFRADYLGLMCLRNSDSVSTTFACVDQLELNSQDLKILSEPHFTIRPDKSHIQNHGTKAQIMDEKLTNKSFSNPIRNMEIQPQKVSVLFGDLNTPYLRVDPYFMDEIKNPDAKQALAKLISQVDKNLTDVVLQPGDVCFIDNYRVVHGRRSFRARYDGKDRWLKRINVVRDLRKSRAIRDSCSSRVFHSNG